MTPAPVFSKISEDDVERSTKLLQHHLSNSSIEPDESGVPYANPSGHLSFSSFVSLLPPNSRSYDASIFRLGHALFDGVDLRLDDSITPDIRTRILALYRKDAVSTWLEEAVARVVDNELKKHPSTDPSAAIFTLLTGNQVEKACEVAMNGRNFKLATLVAQASGDLEFKADLRDQLHVWRDQRIDVHVNENIRKVYGLLAGIVGVLEGSNGTGLEACPDVLVSEGLDWKRRFGLHLWHAEPSDSTLENVFTSYDTFWKEASQSSLYSPSWYTDDSSHAPESSQSTSQPPDALFSLLRLFAEPACSLSNILIPRSFGGTAMDYSLPWHLYILLSRCMRIRDLADRGDPGTELRSEDADDIQIDGHSPSADLLTNSYAIQLEQLGMIQEAAFVLLHIEGSAGYAYSVPSIHSMAHLMAGGKRR
jgi:nuclear pore complex protein Nup98-Nup96